LSEAGPNLLPAPRPTHERAGVRLACDAMGTRFEAVLHGRDAVLLRAAGEAALDVVRDWDRRFNWFSPGSTLSHVNARAADSSVSVDGDLFNMLSLCREVWMQSEGAFDITIAPLLAAWGLRGKPACDPAGISRASSLVGMEKVIASRDRTVRFTSVGVSIDLGSIAKGAALDAAAAVLRECGVTSALLHGGTSSIVAIGAPPGRDAWTIAIETGRSERPPVRLRDTSMSVSAPRGRTAMTVHGPVGHIIDPRSGSPIQRAGTVAVVHPSGALCDAWSTALLVLGRLPDSLPEGMSATIDLHPIRENAA